MPLPLLLPGITVSTDSEDYLPFQQLRLRRFNGRTGWPSATFWTTAERTGTAKEEDLTSIVSGERRISYPEIHARIARAAAGFKAFGLGGGTPVGMMLRNDFAFFEVSGAAAALGSPVVPITAPEGRGSRLHPGRQRRENPGLPCRPVPQISHGLPGDIKLLVVTTPPEIAATFNVAPALTHVPDGMTAGTDGATRTRHRRNRRSAARRCSIRRARPASRRACAQADAAGAGCGRGPRRRHRLWREAERGSGHPDERPDVPFGAEFLRHAGVPQRRTIVLEPRFDPEDMLQLIERHRVTHMHMVPTMFVRLLRLPEDVKRRYDLSSLRFIVHGAAPCPPQVKRAMIEWWGPVINEYFGPPRPASRCGIRGGSAGETRHRRPRHRGRHREDLPPGRRAVRLNEPGEIFMRQMSLPISTITAMPRPAPSRPRRPVSVGDVGYLDADGYLFLCDRKRDMVISGGVTSIRLRSRTR